MEFWKDIKGYNGEYQISNLGRVKSYKNDKEKILSQNKNCKGYYKVNLSMGIKIHKPHLIHKLVAEYFIENPNNEQYINHINHERDDNRIENLEWCNMRENVTHGILFKVKLKSNSIGANYHKQNNKYSSSINVNGKVVKLGYFNTEEDACKAYMEAMIRYGITNKYANLKTA